MTLDFTGFWNQFILCKLEKHIPSGWDKKELGGWLLGFHPSLPIVEIQSSDSFRMGWLLGYPINENSQILKKAATYEPGDKDLSGFGPWLYRLGGTFIAILITPRMSRVYLDAGGSLSAVFHSEYEIVASTPTLVSFAQDDQALIEIMRVPEFNEWFPFGLTPKKSVERLIPNHYLDLVTWNTCRHWPEKGSVTIRQNTEATVREIAQVITRNIKGVVREHPVHMSLTAGQDSRALLACARNLLDNIHFFTMQIPDEMGALDCTIAPDLAQRFNLDHEIIKSQPATKEQRKEWLDRTGHCIGGRISHSFAMLYQLNPEYPTLSGSCGAVGRAYYYNKLGISPDTRLTGENLPKLFRFPQTPEIIDRAGKWLQELSDYDLLTILDLFDIEQRSGCWAAPQQYGVDWSVFTVLPFCHRKFFESVISLPHDYRIKQKLNFDIMRTLWPELLEFPINNYRGIRGLGKNIHKLGKNIRKLAIFQGLKKAVRSLRKDGSRV